ncbi:NUDIX hydrolase [Streptomyces sp. NPDC048584]|uniref:NUDIX hydrolase n=1 Tax=Streptomyces sp. NPDC048584 TaxID=3365573 RepID=UPI003715208E
MDGRRRHTRSARPCLRSEAQRRPAAFPDCWHIVGGHVEPGESLPDALVREVQEETG